MIILEPNIEKVPFQICSKCIYDERVNAITFDEEGVCNYCRQIENLQSEYGTGTEKGNKELESIIEKVKKSGKRKKYDWWKKMEKESVSFRPVVWRRGFCCLLFFYLAAAARVFAFCFDRRNSSA